mgnify:CR=1
MAKATLPRIDDAPRQQDEPQQTEEQKPQHAKPDGPGYSAEVRAWSRIEVKSIPMGLRKALCAKMCEAQMSGARLSSGKEITDKRGLVIWILENALGVR